MEEDLEKLKKRAERFGTVFVAPSARQSLGGALGASGNGLRSGRSRKLVPEQHPQPGFKTGLDLFSQEEQVKRKSRAQRFAIEETASYKPIEDEEEQARRERAKRFNTEFQAKDQSGLQSEDLLEERKDVGRDIERRPEAVHLYGVDRLSTREVQAYFQDYGPRSVEWIDDSCCNVVFADVHSAKRAIASSGQPLGSGAFGSDGLDASDLSSLPFLWHKGEDYIKRDGSHIPLIFRMATVEDRKGMAPSKPPRYLWMNGHVRNTQTRDSQQRRAPKRRLQSTSFDEDEAGVGAPGRVRLSQPPRIKRLAIRPGSKPEDTEELEETEVHHAVTLEGPIEDQEQDPAKIEAVRARQRAEGPSGLFSAAAAGLVGSPQASGSEEGGDDVVSEDDERMTDGPF